MKLVLLSLSLLGVFLGVGCDNPKTDTTKSTPSSSASASSMSAIPSAPTAAPASPAMIERGKYLTALAGCHDCHTPKKMGPEGPELDMSKMLSGQPEAELPPPAPALGPPWMAVTNATLNTWSGPWGTTFAKNLTPDTETGLGNWTEDNFIQAMRTGKDKGSPAGRQILPPMPWEAVGKMTDEDLKSVFAFLRSIPAVKNKVPDPLPPAAAPKAP